MKKFRKGFTLVELLIVIGILGALSSMLAVSGTNAMASSEATKIVANLQTLKTAALMFRMDYIYSKDSEITVENFNTLSADYIDPATMKEIGSNYGVFITAATATAMAKWYAIYIFNKEAEATQIKKLLAARAERVGLLPATDFKKAPTDNGTYFAGGDKATAVALRIR